MVQPNIFVLTMCSFFRSLSGNNIMYVPDGILQQSQSLALLELKGNPLRGVHPYAFASLPKLRKL